MICRRCRLVIFLLSNIFDNVHCSDSLRKYAAMATLEKKSYSREHPKGLPLRQWLQLRIPIIAEHNTVTSNYILPPEMMTRKEIREMYLSECGLQPGDPLAIQKSRFNEILKVWLSQIKLSCVLCVHTGTYFQNQVLKLNPHFQTEFRNIKFLRHHGLTACKTCEACNGKRRTKDPPDATQQMKDQAQRTRDAGEKEKELHIKRAM